MPVCKPVGFPTQAATRAKVTKAFLWYTEFNDNKDSLNAKLFYRYDSMDKERSHGDIRELYWLHVGDDWEFTLGINKVFWGVTESQHLVDIVNQTDFVEAPDGEEKLGQAMAHLALIRDWGVVDLFVLPGFRPQTFAGVEGRLRSIPLTVADAETYESGEGQDHIDLAARWSHYIGDLTIGVSGFSGTSREPVFRPLGIDTQYIVGDWLWKLEAIRRNYEDSRENDYTALTGGFEFTYVGIFDTIFDLGFLTEYSYDSRKQQGGGVLQDDVLLGGRLAFNDAASSEVLFGYIQDLKDSNSNNFFVEASTRIGDRTKVSLETAIVQSKSPSDPQFSVRNDSYLEFSADFYF